MKSIIVFSALLVALSFNSSAQTMKVPSFEEVISLQSVSNPQISPDGKSILFSKTSVDWKENSTDNEIWISKNGDTPFQLTNNPKGSSNNPKWSPDGQ